MAPRPAVPDPRFWERRKVFVTGHTGFVGGWLTLWLSRMGARVAGYSLPAPTVPSFYEAVDIARRLDASTTGDVRSPEALFAAMRAFEPEVALHLAAQPLVGAAQRDSLGTFATNAMGTANFLEAARAGTPPRAIVVFTSDKVYENRGKREGHVESDPLGGDEPYGLSKAAAEMAAAAWKAPLAKGGAGLCTVRAGNIIGGGDWAENRLVPDAVRAFGAGQPLVLRNPEAIRPWQHVLDGVRGLLVLAERLHGSPESFSGAWNLGPSPDTPATVGVVADLAATRWGSGARWERGDAAAFSEAQVLTLASHKARDHLGWVPRWDVAQAVGRSIDWYKAHLSRAHMGKLSEREIEEHSAGA